MSVKGSSPLTRGKLIRRDTSEGQRGLIPAHAGKTSRESVLRCAHGAHAVLPGHDEQEWRASVRSWGSSPLTRGKRWTGAGERPRRGLIPAHAGKTRRSAREHPPPGAHPRSRGENHENIQ